MSQQIADNRQSNGDGNYEHTALQNPDHFPQEIPEVSPEDSAIKLISHYDKELFEYYLNLSEDESWLTSETEKTAEESPPFIVVGLGRCGCHVTAELAEIIASNSASADEITQKTREKGRKMLDLFRSGKSAPVLKFEPLMLVGDIDETAFQDVDGLLKKGGVPEEICQRLLKLNYHPLAEGGVGHVPLFAEFITRGLLLIPTPAANSTDSSRIPARNFLTNNFFGARQPARLIFYIFSTGGGSGSGSASAIMKAQRYAMSVSERPQPQIYFTGVAVMPENVIQNRRHLINTGRNIIQYLADLNIVLENETTYTCAPVFNSSAEVQIGNKRTKMMPWDGLALISNDVMSAIGNESIVPQEVVESNTNQYIAQQMFNLAAAQFSAATFEKRRNSRNY